MTVSVCALHCVWKTLVTLLEQYSTYLVRDMTLKILAFCIIRKPFSYFDNEAVHLLCVFRVLKTIHGF